MLFRGKLNLCDLAGSEKVDKDDHHKSMHFIEMVNINLSLGTLGKVIHSLSCKQSHIPYRDSKLTRLLQGN
jgi:aminopeptidase-like protein